jgi:HNH endonuclease
MSGDTFKFDLHASRTKISRAEFLEGLRAFDQSRPPDARGRVFTMTEFNRWPTRPFAALSAAIRFKGWRHALAAAGIEGRCRGVWSPDELMDALEKVWRKLERPPGLVSMRRHAGIHRGPYARRWGNLINACRRLALYKEGKLTREELLRPTVEPKRKRPSRKLRWQILQRDHHRCTACGATANDGAKLEVDHIKPLCAGGTNDPSNLRTLCRACNGGKGSTTEPLRIIGPLNGRRNAA